MVVPIARMRRYYQKLHDRGVALSTQAVTAEYASEIERTYPQHPAPVDFSACGVDNAGKFAAQRTMANGRPVNLLCGIILATSTGLISQEGENALSTRERIRSAQGFPKGLGYYRKPLLETTPRRRNARY